MKRFLLACVLALVPGTTLVAADDALDEVNAARARRGLPPYLRDDNLTQGAKNLADFRAARFIHGHTANDFAGLPPGTTAASAGCGALEPSWGFQSCAMYESCRYAGAASTMGRDGRRYCQIFVR